MEQAIDWVDVMNAVASEINPPDDKVKEYTGVEAELADAIIRICDLAAGRKWRVFEAMAAKMQYNTTRARLHGKEF